jgi:NodT family efflux transporter outer membrane factor (OMF) lipoprotein
MYLSCFSLVASSALAATLLFTGCSHQAASFGPPKTFGDEFSRSGDAPLTERWWESFDDPQLNRLMDQALAENFSLQSSWARLAQFEAIRKRARSNLLPSLTAGAGADYTEQINAGNSLLEGEGYDFSLNAAYEVDLWGRLRSQEAAARLDLEAERENLKTAAITLSAAVASTWYSLQEQYTQLEVLNNQIKVNEDTLNLIEVRFRRGQSDSTDVLQQRRLAEQRRGERENVLSRIEVLENALAVLIARDPVQQEFEKSGLLEELPPLPEAGIPADLVRRRPDVRAAYFSVQAADFDAAAAIADRYPTLRLTASGRTNGDSVSELFDSWLVNLAAGITAPLYDGGRRNAEVDRTRAVVAAEYNTFARTLLEALEEVENALEQEYRQQQFIVSLEKQLELARETTRQTGARYLRGAETYLQVLSAQQAEQVLERSLLSARQDLIGFRIDLNRALAGGWELTQPEAYPKYKDYLSNFPADTLDSQ